MEFFDDGNSALFESIHEQSVSGPGFAPNHQGVHGTASSLNLYPGGGAGAQLEPRLGGSGELPMDRHLEQGMDNFAHRDSFPEGRDRPAYPDTSIDPLDASAPYSPALSFHGTPIMSPHALAPHDPSNPIPTPGATLGSHQDGSVGSASSSVGSSNKFAMYYQPQVSASSRMTRPQGKISKPSPALRWQKTGMDDDEFRLEDPALAFDLPPAHQTPASAPAPGPAPVHHQQAALASRQHTPKLVPSDDIEERLRSAIQATSRASTAVSSRRASSVSSQRTTPRIRPKISGTSGANSTDPSPLMRPYDTPDEDVFLKSNYHNLVDGTHHHLGLSSADQIASELRSKKTVHKLAEQERRNRMNLAIADLAKVIGPSPVDDKSVASKAATVERAAEYIKKLHARIAELESKEKN